MDNNKINNWEKHITNAIISEYMINGTLTSDRLPASNTFNCYFGGIGPLLASEIKSDINPLDYLSRTVDSIFIPEITVLEVQNTIRELKHSIFKLNTDLCSKTLIHIINEYIKSGIFPDEVKIPKLPQYINHVI